ncbi:MAG: L,D-transpeptidase [Elusimicrobia bacterium]|nr:L,D-transpeptidase [Elusimicrobiota bacterium]
MKIRIAALTALLLSIASSGSAFDLPGLVKGARLPGLPAATSPQVPGDIEALRAEAAADPAAFIDGHTPAEVSLAFGLPLNSDEAEAYGLPASRYLISSAKAKLAPVRIVIDLGAQRLNVEGPEFSKVFKISSGLPPKYGTPGSGKCFAPDFIEEMHYSSLYNKAPMPNSIFFNGNIAIHGTEAEWLLGKTASHGCIRLSKANAKTLYELVKANGKSKASVCVEGKTPVPAR